MYKQVKYNYVQHYGFHLSEENLSINHYNASRMPVTVGFNTQTEQDVYGIKNLTLDSHMHIYKPNNTSSIY
jgi:hypothetical protein